MTVYAGRRWEMEQLGGSLCSIFFLFPLKLAGDCARSNAPINVNPVGGECGQGEGI